VYVCAKAGTLDSNVHAVMERAARANMVGKLFEGVDLKNKRKRR